MGVALRPRQPDDLAALLVLLQRTHEQDGYPVRAAAVSDGWLASADELGAWVAVEGTRVLGHVALHPADGAAVPLWEQATRRPAEQLAVVSRFFTDGSVRGAGTALLTHAVEQAHAVGRDVVLQVDPDSDAVDFYRRRGWREVGSAVQQWGQRTVGAVAMVHPG